MSHTLVFAQSSSSTAFWLGLLGRSPRLLVFFGFVLLVDQTVQALAPATASLVIYGKGGPRQPSWQHVHGGAAFVIPLLQDFAFLSLEPIQIEVPLRLARFSMENIRVNVPSVFTVAVGTSPEVMQNAAIRLLGLNFPQVKKQAEEMIFGQLRQVIASMKIEDINRDRDTFLHHIQSSLEPELKKIGLVLINVNITDITDESGYIDAIGQKAASQAIQQARGDVADQERMGETRVAAAERDRQIQVANAHKERDIGTREAEREQAVRLAELEKEQKVGEQYAAFERDAQVKNAHQKLRISLADADAKAIQGENHAQGLVAESQASLLVKKSEAYEIGEKRKREAEAAVLEAQNHCRMAKSGSRGSRTRGSRTPRRIRSAGQSPESQDHRGSRSRSRKTPHRSGRPSLRHLRQARRGSSGPISRFWPRRGKVCEIIQACGGAKEAFQMLMLEHLDKLAETSALAISKIKFDKIVVWENGGKNGKSNTASFLHNMASTMPPMMQVLRDIGGVELPEALIKLGGDEAASHKNSNGDGVGKGAHAEKESRTAESSPVVATVVKPKA